MQDWKMKDPKKQRWKMQDWKMKDLQQMFLAEGYSLSNC